MSSAKGSNPDSCTACRCCIIIFWILCVIMYSLETFWCMFYWRCSCHFDCKNCMSSTRTKGTKQQQWTSKIKAPNDWSHQWNFHHEHVHLQGRWLSYFPFFLLQSNIPVQSLGLLTINSVLAHVVFTLLIIFGHLDVIPVLLARISCHADSGFHRSVQSMGLPAFFFHLFDSLLIHIRVVSPIRHN